MSAEVDISLNVVYEDDDSQEGLLYSGETTLVPLIQPLAWTLCGTPIPFCATIVPSNNLMGLILKERFQTVTVMKVYSGKSIDELRLEDYKYLKKSKPCSSFTLGGTKSKRPIYRAAPGYDFGLGQSNPQPAPNCFGSSTGVTFTSPMSTDPSTSNTQVHQPSQRFSFSPVINFTAQPTADPVYVFQQSHPPTNEADPTSTLTVSEGKQLMDSLLESIIKCMQIQNSLYRLVLLKLGQQAAGCEGEIDAVSRPKASLKKSSGENLNCDPGTLLCELKEPLEALMRCAEIQMGLFQRIITVNLMTTDESAGPPDNSSSSEDSQESPQINMLTVRSDLEEIAFKTRMVCYYARNPFTSQDVKAMTSRDVLQHVCQDKRPLSSRAVSGGESGQRELPHGYGSLKTVTGKLVYKGDWCRGKRHGKGEGLILSVPIVGSNPTTTEHGFYTGGWKNNMRHGSGNMTFVSGTVYEGQWQYDKMTGYGTLKFPDGTIQEGTWKDGSLDGCVLFTWPHGVTEYREYKQGQGQPSSSKIDKETAGKLSQMSSIRSQLLNLRESAAELKDENLGLKDELNTLRTGQADLDRKHQAALSEIRQSFDVQLGLDSEKLRKEFEQKLKDAKDCDLKNAERIRELEKDLEQSREAQLCQICFERPRDCIIMPCTHLLYCRTCVTEHKKNGGSRCPTCRGPISGEILCNVNH